MPDSSESSARVKNPQLSCDSCTRRAVWAQYHRSDGVWHLTCKQCDTLGNKVSYYWDVTGPTWDLERMLDHVGRKAWIWETNWTEFSARVRRAAGL